MSLERRLAALEAARRAWEADHIPAWHVPAFLFDVLQIVESEASPEAAARVCRQIVAKKAEKVEALYLAAAGRL